MMDITKVVTFVKKSLKWLFLYTTKYEKNHISVSGFVKTGNTNMQKYIKFVFITYISLCEYTNIESLFIICEIHKLFLLDLS